MMAVPDELRNIAPEKLVVDQDGDIPVRAGSAVYYVRLLEADFLPEFAEHCLFGGLVLADAPLRELPGIMAGAAGPQDLPLAIGEDDAHIGAEAVGIDHGGLQESNGTWLSKSLFYKYSSRRARGKRCTRIFVCEIAMMRVFPSTGAWP